MSHTYEYARPAVSVDCVVFKAGSVLLIERARDPYAGAWALPGGFLEVGEDPADGAARELAEETGLKGIRLSQIGAYGRPDRDPREHVVSVAFWGEAPRGARVKGDDDAREARWWPLAKLPPLAFDHTEILKDAEARRRSTAGAVD